MFQNNSSFSRDIQSNHFADYQSVLNNFNQIKNATFFINYTNLSNNDLIVISNIIFDSIDKLDLMSLHFIKKNREKLSESLVKKFEKMEREHLLLIEKIGEFNNIVEAFTIFNKTANTQNNFTCVHIISKYKFVLYQIIGTIKRLIAYADILKERL
jgi:hypothetical protein